ncbi:hypothetical protein G9A89_007854 [Geosiphon pyriformis]|nr:hypothetical protein G9A89_007854 [Geosiphon pyriformis]
MKNVAIDERQTLCLITKELNSYFIDLILDNRLSVSIIAKHFLETIGKKIDELFTRPMTNVHNNNKKDLDIAKAVSLAINGLRKQKPCLIINSTTPPILKQSQKKKQSDESDDEESDKEDKQEEQKETAELVYTIFTNNSKPLDNIKANKEKIMVNDKLICWPYYDILRKIFDRKPGKKAKYSYCNKYMSCLIYYKD